MAKKASKKKAARKAATAGKKRIRRTPDQMIADLQKEIERVKERARAKELKSSAATKSALAAVRAIDRGLEQAAQEDNSHLRHAFADARRALGTYLEGQGLKLPKVNLPKGPKPK